MDLLLEAPFCMTMCAPRKTGKSFFIKTMLNNGLREAFDLIIIACPSLSFNDDYDEFRDKPKMKFMANPSIEAIDDVFIQLEKAQKKCMEHKRAHSKTQFNCPKVLIILDDCIDSNLFNFRGVTDKIAERGRHINLSCIIASQRISAVSRSIRINSDFFVIFSPYSARELEQFIEQFVFKDHRKQLISKLLGIFSKPYTFIMLNNLNTNINEKMLTSNADDFVKNKYEIIHFELDQKAGKKRKECEEQKETKKQKTTQ